LHKSIKEIENASKLAKKTNKRWNQFYF
jgi:hypothetical protein